MSSAIKFVEEIISTPAILLGLIALAGLILQGAKPEKIIGGTIKTILGFVLVTVGAQVVSESLRGFDELFELSFGVIGVVPNTDAMAATLMNEFGSAAASIMILGFAVNVLLARFTPLKYIFLTGHICLYFAILIAACLTKLGLTDGSLVAVGGILLGVLMVLLPALAQPTMRKITGKNDVALAHAGTIAYWLAAQAGKLFAANKKSTEEINFPKTLNFMRDSSISIALVMFPLYVVVCVWAKSPAEILDGKNFLLYSLIQSVTFAAGVYVILTGVRLVIAEIVPAFKGISKKLVSHAKPAIDCPIVFPYAPNAVLIGFIASFVGCLFGLGVIIFFNGLCASLPLILPGVVPQFFCGATAGVFGNATGGIKGCIVGAFLNGVITSILAALSMELFMDLGYSQVVFGDSDFNILALLLLKLVEWGN